MKKHIYEYDEIVVGSTLAALFYCYKNLRPLLFVGGAAPFIFEHFEEDFPFENVFFTNELHQINTPEGQISVGRKKLEIYNQLLFILSTSGLVPFSDKIEKIRLEEKQLRIITNRARTLLIKFNQLRVFPPDFVEGMKVKRVEKQPLKVLDYFKIISKKHSFDLIDVGDHFVDKIYFIESEQRKDVKHVVVISFLNSEEVESFDFSIIPLKYKLKATLEQSGIEKRDYDSHIKLDFIKRDLKVQDIKHYKSEDIIIDTRSEREICQDQQQLMRSNLLGAYPWRLHHLLLDSNGMIR